jgi:type VI secretion system secreted protein VgrG
VKNCRDTKIDVDRTEKVGKNTTEEIGMNWKVTAGMKIEFICGTSKITMTPMSIKIEALKIDVIAQTMMTTKGLMNNVKGDGMVVVNAPLVKIN